MFAKFAKTGAFKPIIAINLTSKWPESRRIVPVNLPWISLICYGCHMISCDFFMMFLWFLPEIVSVSQILWLEIIHLVEENKSSGSREWVIWMRTFRTDECSGWSTSRFLDRLEVCNAFQLLNRICVDFVWTEKHTF